MRGDLEMKLHRWYIIFITLATTVGLYCFLLIFAAGKKQSEVYYLADNNRNHLFAYLISVQTRGYPHSGTTSNVTVRLVGKNASSDPHVLNYPDPKLRLLQKFNTDMFVLTTKHHLGFINKLELWFDCSGPSPDWFCKDITIYDMQQYSSSYFKVKKRLAVLNGDAYVELTPTKTNWVNKIKFVRNYHTWWFLQDEENFSYVNRLTVLLSMVLTTFTIILILVGVPQLELQDSFDEEYKVDGGTVFDAVIGSLPTFLIHMVFVWGFRFSKMQLFKQEILKELISRITFVCWIILVLQITTSVSLLIVAAFWTPYNKSLMWLTTCAIALVFDIFIYETIFAFIQNLFCQVGTYNIGKKLNEIWKATECQREILYENFDALLLRPYFTHLYEPMKTTTIQIKQKVVKHRRSVASELEDLVMFGIYIVILYLVVLSDKDSRLVLGKTTVENMLQAVYTRTGDFHDIKSIHEFYEYVNSTLLPSVQPIRWYGNFVISEPAMTIDMNNKYMGVIRLRQQRIKPNLCVVAKPMIFLGVNCSREISIYNYEVGFFGYGKKALLQYLKFDRLRRIWTYVSVLKSGSLGTIGKFSIYSGGGYISYLGRSLYNSYANFRELIRKVWLDDKSRGIFIEFLTYNANYNMFNAVELLFERSVSGYTFTRVKVVTARMLFLKNEILTVSFISLFFFVIWVIVLFLKQTFGTIKKIRYFYKDLWFLLDFLIITMSIVCIVFFILRMRMIKSYLDELERAKKNQFVNYFYIFYVDDFMKIFAAILICISTARLWKFLRFGLMFRILERTLVLSTVSVLTVLICYFIIVVTYAMMIMLLFGNEHKDAHAFSSILRQLIVMYLQAKKVNIRRFTLNTISYFYLSLYIVVLKSSAVLLIMIIVMSYSEAQLEFSANVQEYNIRHYIQERINYLPRLLRYKYSRLKAGQDDKRKIRPKPEKFLYLNSFAIRTNRMKTMAHVTRNIIRKNRPLQYAEVDLELMRKFCEEFFSTREKRKVEVFFKGRVKGNRISLIDEDRIVTVRKTVGRLLEEESNEGSKSEDKKYQFWKECAVVIKDSQEVLRRCNLILKLNVLRLNNLDDVL